MNRFTSFPILVAITLSAFTSNNKPQIFNYSFDVTKTGAGSKSIIFIPGFACSSHVWDETKSSYVNDYTCYTLTMAGFAGVPPQSHPTFKNWENEIATFIQENKIVKPIVIGHSMGGDLAMALAADYPELVSKIIVVDALPCLAAIMNPSFKPKENNDCDPIISQITSATNEQFYQMQKQTISRLLADTSEQELVISWSTKSDRRTFAEIYCDISNTDLRENITSIRCPALILLEPYYANIKPTINEQFKNLKTANLQYATKGLHFIMYDDKEWYLDQLNKFIAQ